MKYNAVLRNIKKEAEEGEYKHNSCDLTSVQEQNEEKEEIADEFELEQQNNEYDDDDGSG